MTDTLDAPGTVCSFASHDCSTAMSGHGGFDEHHEYPISLGGAADQTTMLTLCPNHHRRQHSLIRYLVEAVGAPTAREVTEHFTPDELSAAISAVASWQANGSPPIAGWPCPAARVTG